MTPFELLEPRTLREAAAMLDADSARPVAGGTAVMLMMKLGVFRPARLVSLRAVEERYSDIAVGPDGELHIGAMAHALRARTISGHPKQKPPSQRRCARVKRARAKTSRPGRHLAHADSA